MNLVLPTTDNEKNLEDFRLLDDNESDIRPLAVRPLNHFEREPNPWGFLFSGSSVRMAYPDGVVFP
ncbi:MAG TPA: hypothetical protein ENJ31_01150 [Anaerolineae bacterium]|nr:hypothetical protein [Anaerolineae bacterium]